jgi:hypothetical protein
LLGTSLFQIKVPGEPPRGEAAGIGNQAEEALKLFLAVSGFWTVFTQVMMLRNVDGDSGFGSAQERTSEGEAGNVLQTVGVFDGLGGALTPSEWGVAGDKNAGDGNWVQVVLAEVLDDDGTGVPDVGFGDFVGGEGPRDGNRAVEIVGVGGAEAGDGAAGLRPRSCELRVRVNDAADLGELAVEQSVGVEIAGRVERAFDNFAVEIGDDQIGGGERGVIDAAGLDDDEGFRAGSVDSTCVAKGVGRQAATSDFLVGMEDLFAERLEQHDFSLSFRRDQGSSSYPRSQ